MTGNAEMIRWLSDLGRSDGDIVGGKNASLGEMVGRLREAGVRVPGGFATTASAYRAFIAEAGLNDAIADRIGNLKSDRGNLAKIGGEIRKMMLKADLPPSVASAIKGAYRRMAEESGQENPAIAARSSATAEDLPEAFAAPDLKLTRWGTVSIDFRSMMTSLDGVFAAGMGSGSSLKLVRSSRQGRVPA